MTFRARFIPKHPEKYIGDFNNIFCRSSWELRVMTYFDSRSDVIRWGSEEAEIPYINPLDNKVHRYIPDFFVEYVDRDGNLQREIVEVKPLHESEKVKAKSKFSKDRLEVNEAKWSAAAIHCAAKGFKFRVLTERSIFHHGDKRGKV